MTWQQRFNVFLESLFSVTSNDNFLVRSCQIASNLIAKHDSESVDQSYKMYLVFFYLADFCFEAAIICQICLWYANHKLKQYKDWHFGHDKISAATEIPESRHLKDGVQQIWEI